MSTLDLVREFQTVFSQPIHNAPHIHDDRLNDLRIALIDEELAELVTALEEQSEVGVLDALGDLLYVVYGAALSWGYGGCIDAAIREIHRSNLSKLDADGKPVYRSDGKVTKGPAYSPPNLIAVLERDAARRDRIARFNAVAQEVVELVDAFNDEEPTHDLERPAVKVPA
jgi:predicted HAD superfamily Cof-like phosphohydrolase